MLLVIADTSPIRYLAQIGHIGLLHSLFQTVSIPTEVASELSDPSAPAPVQAWIKAPPSWLNVLEAGEINDPALDGLDPGERSAIALGISLKADLILIDERKGSRRGKQGVRDHRHPRHSGLAAKRKLIDLRDSVDRLKQTNFRYRKDIIDNLLAQF
jgi:predicted nucleic acid-binding protein